MKQIKSRQRVADHGEVFTPEWMVKDMLKTVEMEANRIDSRFLEPACGNGNFLAQILNTKLSAAAKKYKKNRFDEIHFSIFALMCTYGIELLKDNVQECRETLHELLVGKLELEKAEEASRAAMHVLSVNIIHGDALKMRMFDNSPICFAEWGYLGKGRYQRRDFRLQDLTMAADFGAQGSLFSQASKQDLFSPIKTHRPMTISELAMLHRETQGELSHER